MKNKFFETEPVNTFKGNNISENFKQSKNRLINFLKDIFKNSEIEFEIPSNKLAINLSYKDKSIVCHIWVRPYGKHMIDVYPRLNLPNEVMNYETTFQYVKNINDYYLVILLGVDNKPRQFLFGKYNDISFDDYRLENRFGKRIDRLIFGKNIWQKSAKLPGLNNINIIELIKQEIKKEHRSLL